MSHRIVWLRALAVGSIGVAVAGLWAGAVTWQAGNHRGGAVTAVLGVLLAATFLRRLRELGRAAAAGRAGAAPPAA